MLEYAFSFRGRIGRLRYFASSMALGAVFVGIIVAVFILVNPTKSPGTALLLGGIAMLLLLPVMLWSSLALQARRIRDIGLDPLFVMPTFVMVMIADAIVARAVPHLAVVSHSSNTIFGLLINLAFSLALLFWPGNGGSDADDMRRRLGVFDADAEPQPTLEAPRILAPRLAQPSGRPVRTTFGRRGA